MKAILILAPILALFALGLLITLRSGAVGVSGGGGGMRAIAGNFSAMIVHVVGYLAVILAVQHLIGYPALLGW